MHIWVNGGPVISILWGTQLNTVSLSLTIVLEHLVKNFGKASQYNPSWICILKLQFLKMQLGWDDLKEQKIRRETFNIFLC